VTCVICCILLIYNIRRLIYGRLGIKATSGDSTQLIFLRSRWYNPADGRFQSRDTWEGDANRPMSMNRWNYVEANPVNLIDPSGKFPIKCQSMATKEEYATCVLNFYDLEPYDKHNLSLSVEGDQGCYSGPEKYRAPGYLEGLGGQIGPILSSVEAVYDFAAMQGEVFYSTGFGSTIPTIFPIVADSVFFGVIKGFVHSDEDTIEDNYGGQFSFRGIDVNDMNPYVAINGGALFFTSTKDPEIRGVNFYFGASVGIPGASSLPAGVPVGVTTAFPLDGVTTDYILPNGRVNTTALYNDSIVVF